MLEYLFFRIGGYFEGNKVLLMCNQGGQLSLDYYELSRRNSVSIPHYSATWTKQRSKRWISKFAALIVRNGKINTVITAFWTARNGNCGTGSKGKTKGGYPEATHTRKTGTAI